MAGLTNFSFPPASANKAGATASTSTSSGAASKGFCFAAPPPSQSLPLGASQSAGAVTKASSGLGASTISGLAGATASTSTSSGAAPAGFSFAARPPSESSVLGASQSAGAVTKASSGLGASIISGSGTASAPTLPIAQASTAVTTSNAPPKLTFGATSAAGPTVTAVTTASATVASSSTSAPKMTYKELEEQMNKWSMELDHQEKVFLEQATKVNAWDKVLIENGQKITNLNADVGKIKLDQDRLTNELDFIVAQQAELEEMLTPLEESVAKLPPINYQQHTDTEREHTYQIAENIDAQLKRMTEDLKEVIDHLNTGTGAQDVTDPMLQISKILNAHMESLQWVDQNAALLQRKTAEVTRYAESTRKEHERNLRLAYS